LTITSPQRGTVIARLKVEGDYVKTGDPIYRIADLSTVWLMLELYPSDAAQVRYAQEVDVELSAEPGVVFPGRVAFIDPIVSAATRTVQVRVELFNSDGRFKPGDYATAKLRLPAVPNDTVYDAALAGAWISPRHPQIVRDGPGECPLCDTPLVPTSDFGYAAKRTANAGSVTAPRSAILLAGENSVAYVEVKEGEFELRNVVVAALTPTEAALAGGIAEGEVVATDGAFLIDSQMQLAGKPSLIDPLRNSKPAAPTAGEAPHAH
jgi:Cu(I)/Ag(I) efflux system membrane fusion protein